MPEPMGSGEPSDPWELLTPPLTSAFTMHRDVRDERAVPVCTVGKTVLLYYARCLEDLQAMLRTQGDWVELGSAAQQKRSQAEYRRSLDAVAGQSDWGMVWAEDRPSGVVWPLYSATDGAPWSY